VAKARLDLFFLVHEDQDGARQLGAVSPETAQEAIREHDALLESAFARGGEEARAAYGRVFVKGPLPRGPR